MYSSKVARGQWIGLEVPPDRTSTTKVYVKADVAKGGDGKLLQLVIDAPHSTTIVKNPDSLQARDFPDGGVSCREGQAFVSRFEKEKQEKAKARREAEQAAQDAQTQKA
ncbi:MAG: hypothetical protein ACX94C_07675 [Phycisphaerales bacterium]